MASYEDILEQQGVLVYTNVGISMMPLLRQNRDLLYITKPEGRLRMWDVPLFRRYNAPPDRTYVMHRVLWVGKHSYIICGDNQWWPEFGVRDEQIIGVLDTVKRMSADGQQVEETIVVRSTPEHPKVPFKYRLYVFVWCFFFPIRAALFMVRGKWWGLKRRLNRTK